MKSNTFSSFCKKGILAILTLGLSFSAVVPVSAADNYKAFSQKEYKNAEIVSVNGDGSLVYATDPASGSSLPDYSRVGYHNGEKEIPSVPVVKTLEPGTLSDHTSLIQSAINQVSALPLEQRGAILLKAGVYILSGKLEIKASGIVLRGEGQGENGTILYDSRNSQNSTLSLSGKSSYTVIGGTKSNITDDKVPMGETKIHIAASDAAKYKVGDSVVVTITPNEAWIKALGVDNLSGTGIPWVPEDFIMEYERTILAIDGNAITLDTAITMTMDKTYNSCTISKIEDSGRITEAGIENLRFVSYYDQSIEDDENHGWTAININNCRDCWVKDVTSVYYGYGLVQLSRGATQVTVDGCSCLEPVSQTSGGRKYSFCINGASYVLMKNCFSEKGRHDFVVQARTPGPNVFYNCVVSNSYSVSEPHHRWGTGTLYDNIYQIGTERTGYFQAIMRGNSGTGHGWAGVNTVFWNCLSGSIVVRKPQTEQNFIIGTYGLYGKTGSKGSYDSLFVKPDVAPADYPTAKSQTGSPFYGNGYIESWYNPVNPSSLYQAQLSYRLAGHAAKNVTPISPILQYPLHDEVVKSSELTVSGVCDINAGRINIYIDGKLAGDCLPTDKSGSVVFSKKLTLTGGYHTLQITQMFGNVESAPTAVRVIRINNGDANDIEAPSIEEVLIELKNQTAIKDHQRKIDQLKNEIESYRKSLEAAFDKLKAALQDYESALQSGDETAQGLGWYTFNFHKNKISTNADEAGKFLKRAEELGCDDAVFEQIQSALKEATDIAPKIAVLIARGEREYETKTVESISIDEELAQSITPDNKDNNEPTAPPATTPLTLPIILSIVGVVAIATVVIILLIRKKSSSKKAA